MKGIIKNRNKFDSDSEETDGMGMKILVKFSKTAEICERLLDKSLDNVLHQARKFKHVEKLARLDEKRQTTFYVILFTLLSI